MLNVPEHDYELYQAFLSGIASREIEWTPVPKEEFLQLSQVDRRRLIHELKELLRTPSS